MSSSQLGEQGGELSLLWASGHPLFRGFKLLALELQTGLSHTPQV